MFFLTTNLDLKIFKNHNINPTKIDFDDVQSLYIWQNILSYIQVYNKKKEINFDISK